MPPAAQRTKHFGKPIDSYTFVVPDVAEPLRLDRFLARRMPWRSRTFFQAMVARGEVNVNGRGARASRVILPGDTIVVDISKYQQPFTPPPPTLLDIIFEDDDLLILNKPPGVVVHPTGMHLYDTLLNAIHTRYHDAEYKPRLVHRLDKETSGVLVCVKNEAARSRLARQIEGRHVLKTYCALVHGIPPRRDGEIVLPLGDSRHSHIRLKQGVVRQGGLPARTLYSVAASAPVVPGVRDGVALLNVQLLTGRTHQIRVHLSAIGHPILVDKLYGRETHCCVAGVTVNMHLLHAWEYRFTHPTSGAAMTFRAPLSAAFAACVENCFGPAVAAEFARVG